MTLEIFGKSRVPSKFPRKSGEATRKPTKGVDFPSKIERRESRKRDLPAQQRSRGRAKRYTRERAGALYFPSTLPRPREPECPARSRTRPTDRPSRTCQSNDAVLAKNRPLVAPDEQNRGVGKLVRSQQRRPAGRGRQQLRFLRSSCFESRDESSSKRGGDRGGLSGSQGGSAPSPDRR